MTTVLIVALVAASIAHIWLLDRKDKRHAAQLDRLLQRIQAPEQAVAEFSTNAAFEGPLYRNLGDRDELPEEAVAD